MAKRKKFYGIRFGFDKDLNQEVRGVVAESWSYVFDVTNGVPGAKQAGFATREEAERYAIGEDIKPSSCGIKSFKPVCYVSGSKKFTKYSEAKAYADANGFTVEGCRNELEAHNYSDHAYEYAYSVTQETVAVPEAKTGDCVEIYTDGSFKEGVAGAAFIAVSGDEVIGKGGCTAPDKYCAQNVYGETLAVVKALQWARKNNVDKITIFHDYVGVAAWVTPHLTKPGKTVWTAKEAVSKNYQQAYFKFAEGLDVSFIKVAAHTGDKYNEMADQLAKEYASKR